MSINRNNLVHLKVCSWFLYGTQNCVNIEGTRLQRCTQKNCHHPGNCQSLVFSGLYRNRIDLAPEKDNQVQLWSSLSWGEYSVNGDRNNPVVTPIMRDWQSGGEEWSSGVWTLPPVLFVLLRGQWYNGMRLVVVVTSLISWQYQWSLSSPDSLATMISSNDSDPPSQSRTHISTPTARRSSSWICLPGPSIEAPFARD